MGQGVERCHDIGEGSDDALICVDQLTADSWQTVFVDGFARVNV